MFGYLYSIQERFDQAITYARRALDRRGSFFSHNLMAWILVAGESDIDRGISMAQMALENPPSSSPFNHYVKQSPYVPLPQHTLGLGYMKKGDFTAALDHLEKALQLRPDDKMISDDLSSCRNQITTSGS
jgi:tetratricopeptide (TPR) repeat protein